jgi:glycosyltransferase involved in cell wall biosynthesis
MAGIEVALPMDGRSGLARGVLAADAQVGGVARYFPIFLSVVLIVRNQSAELRSILEEATKAVASLVSDYEIVVVDNASEDDSAATLQALTQDRSLPNLQVFVLTKEVGRDTAASAGLESALGDFVVMWDPMTDDIEFAQVMLEQAVIGTDAVFAYNEVKPPEGLLYRLCFAIFNALYKGFNGIHLVKDVPQFRVLSRRVVNFILQHSAPALAYRHLPATAGFAHTNLTYRSPPRTVKRKPLLASIERGIRTLISTSRAPMRIASALSLFGALANIIYSVYVLTVALVKDDVAHGWVTLSLQQSGMFFLISVVLLMLGEYLVHMTQLSNLDPGYHLAKEYTSTLVTRREKLNVEHEDPALRRTAHTSGFQPAIQSVSQSVEPRKVAQ